LTGFAQHSHAFGRFEPKWHGHCTLPHCSSEQTLTDYKGEKPMLWTILVILLVLWLIGFLGHVGGGLIHLLLVIALIVFIINLVSGRRAV
jgi:hypothetical protein